MTLATPSRVFTWLCPTGNRLRQLQQLYYWFLRFCGSCQYERHYRKSLMRSLLSRDRVKQFLMRSLLSRDRVLTLHLHQMQSFQSISMSTFRGFSFASICTFTRVCSVKCVGLVCEFFRSSITVGVQVLVELDFFIEEKKERGVYEGGESDADEDKPVLVWIIFRYLFTFQRKWNLKSWVFILSF